MTNNAVLEAKALCKTFAGGDRPVHAVRNADLTVRQGEFIVITGQSGCGKTTLLNILGCIHKPDSGSLTIGGKDVVNADEATRAAFRRRKIGFIYQDFKLLDSLTAAENIVLPSKIDKRKYDPAYLDHLAVSLGLKNRLGHFPHQLSGGQKQRVAIARALLQSPDILLADEPTGNLDASCADEILQILLSLHRSGSSLLMVTHNPSIAALAERQLNMFDGRLFAVPPATRL